MSTVLHFGSTFIVLAATPYMLWRLGLESYGLWALMNTVIRYSLLADFGIGPSVTRHVAQFAARGDRAGVRETATIGALYFTWVGLIAMAGAYFCGPMLLSHLLLSAKLQGQAPGLLTALMGSVALNFALWGSPAATLSGYGRFRHTSAINAAGQVVFAVVAVSMLIFGHGIASLVVAAYAQVLTSAVLGFAAIKLVHGAVFTNPFGIPRRLFGKILRFGGWSQISTVSWIIIADTPAVLAGYLIGVQYVGLLDIATRVARVVKALAYNFNGSLLPAVSALDAELGSVRVAEFLPQAARLLGFIVLFSTGALIASASLLLRAWFGGSPPHEMLMLVVLGGLALTYAVEMLTNVARTAECGLGRPWLDASYTTTYAAVSLLLSLVFSRPLGLPGIALAGFLGAIVGSAVFLIASSSSRTLRIATLLGNWMPRLMLAVFAAAGCSWLVSRELLLYSPSRGAAVVDLFCVALLYTTILLVALRMVGFFSSRDREALRSMLPMKFVPLLDARLAKALFTSS